MKKADLVDVVAQQKNFPRPQVEATIDSLIEAVAEGLARGERIDFPQICRADWRMQWESHNNWFDAKDFSAFRGAAERHFDSCR